MNEPTPQQLAKARAEWPCEHETKCGRITLDPADVSFFPPGTTHWTCEACLIVPRVAALLAEYDHRDCETGARLYGKDDLDQLMHERDSFQAENQRLAGELERSLRKWSDIETEVEQRVSTRRIQAEFELNEMRGQCNSLRARLNLKHSASHTDATQALCGAPPPFVWDNDSGVFCPACKKVETLTSELARARADEAANAAALRVAGQRLRTLTHPPDEVATCH